MFKNLRQFLSLSALVFPLIMALRVMGLDDLDQQFQVPPRQAQPWVYWVWLDSDIPEAAITRDLEEMKAKGIAGCILYGNQSGSWAWKAKTVRSGDDYRAVQTDNYQGSYIAPMLGEHLVTWSPNWRKLVCFSARECARLGIDFVVANGLANTSGSISEEYGEKKLVWSEISIDGPRSYKGLLPEPPDVKAQEWRYRSNVAVLAVPDRPGFSVNDVINLTLRTDRAGRLSWDAPAGSWRILRFVQVPTGAHNQWGYYNDSMSAEAMDETWKVTMAPLLAEMTSDERKALRGIEDDSWEAGKIGWTKLFPEEFQRRRGYDLIPYLPVIAGLKMGNADTRQHVLRDYKLTISDLIADNHYGRLKKTANENGLAFYSEAAGPNYDQADLLKTSSQVDMAMAEFWMPSEHRPTMNSRFLLRNAANANHIYGNKITLCESFTSLGPEWEETPFTMKPVADQAFCDGLNKICVHNFSQSPSLTAKPGYVYVAGTHYEPGVTWWDESPAFNSYLARCSFMLQQGEFVADALFYQGDNIGHGEQRKTIPPTLGDGYDHDNCNSDVLLTRMSVSHERIVLADGMSYRILVLAEDQAMPLEDLKKIAALLEAGATVVGPPPAEIAGMVLNPDDRQQFNALVSRLWGGMDGTRVTRKQVGAGRLFRGPSARQVLQEEGVPPDFEESGLSNDGTMDWIHRAGDGADIYFVASRWEHSENVDCTFRVAGKEPELWDPVTGEIRSATAFRQENGRTLVPLQFGPCGSVFVVFRKPISADISGTTASNYPSLRPLENLSGPWTVDFDPKWGGPSSVVFDELVDWTTRPEEGIKYYSGTAVYHKTFHLEARPVNGGRLILDLGEVHEVAVVRLNGHNLGVVWDKPSRIDITSAVGAGDNDLEITVVNLWPNRLKGDEALPKDKRFTETNIHKFTEASPLWPSGLIGPVSVMVAGSNED
ncbi:MAG TPA: glycosyl hydrolase [Verrucomicrobiae bacterium]